MKITIEHTQKFAVVDGLLCRVWEGVTEGGGRCEVIVPFVKSSDPAVTAELERHLQDSSERMMVPRDWYVGPTPTAN